MDDWRRTVHILWGVQFLTTLAMNLGLTFIPFVLMDDPVLAIEDGPTRAFYTCLILGGPFVTTIVFTPLWGWLGDRTGQKQQVVRACIGLGATQLLMAVATAPWQMVAIRVLQGVVSGVLAASLGLVSSVTPKEQQGRSISYVQSATPAGQIIAPLIGAAFALTLGYRTTYALLGGVILLAGVLSWLLLREGERKGGTAENPFRALWCSGWRAWEQPTMRQAIGLLVAGQFAFTLAQGVFAIYAAKLIGEWVVRTEATPAWWNTGVGFTALAFAITGVANVMTASWWGWMYDRGGRFLTALGAGLMSVSMAVLILWPAWWLVLLSRAGVGAGVGATSNLQFAVLSNGAAPEERGQMMGLATALSQVGNLSGFLLGGVLAMWLGEWSHFAIAAAVYAGVMLVAMRAEWSAGRVEIGGVAAPA